MEATEAIFTQFKAMIDADTGAGGLSNSTGNQYVRGGVVRETDRRSAATSNRPDLVVSVVPVETGVEASGRTVQAYTRASIRVDRDSSPSVAGAAEADAIEDRLVTLFNGVTLAAGSTGWAFSTMTYLRTFWQQSDKMLFPIVEFQVMGSK